MGPSLNAVPEQIGSAVALLRQSRARTLTIAATSTVLVATWSAPGGAAGAVDWLRIGTILIASLLTVLLLADDRPGSADDQPRLLGSLFFLLLAIVVNLTYGLGTAVVYSIGCSLIGVAVLRLRGDARTWLESVLIALLVPQWIWLALDVWDAGLLLLIPLAALAILSTGHRRFAVRRAGGPATISGRAHRLASWLGVLTAALMTLLVGLVSDASNTWVSLGAIGAVLALGLEVGLGRTGSSDQDRGAAAIDVALAWVALAWLISL